MNLFSEIKMLKNLTKCIKIHRKLIFCGKCLICKACGQSKKFYVHVVCHKTNIESNFNYLCVTKDSKI